MPARVAVQFDSASGVATNYLPAVRAVLVAPAVSIGAGAVAVGFALQARGDGGVHRLIRLVLVTVLLLSTAVVIGIVAANAGRAEEDPRDVVDALQVLVLAALLAPALFAIIGAVRRARNA